jgi:EthD domain
MNSTTRPILTEITGPHFSNTADYDVVSQMMFPDVECFTSMLADPFYKENVMPDDTNFADMSRTKYGLTSLPMYLHEGGGVLTTMMRNRMSIGWIEDIVKDGKNVVQGTTEASMNESAA